jgi:hypothetical protein
MKSRAKDSDRVRFQLTVAPDLAEWFEHAADRKGLSTVSLLRLVLFEYRDRELEARILKKGCAK